MEYNDNNENNSTGGNRGKFSDRIKKIRRDKVIRKQDKESSIVTFGRNIFKILLALPTVSYSVIKSSNKKAENIDLMKENSINVDKNLQIDFNERRIKVNKIKNIDVSILKKHKAIYLSELEKKGITLSGNSLENELKIQKLQKEIIGLIKKRLVKNINELEMLQSELYVLKELDSEDIYLVQCQDDIKQIKKLLSKVKALKEKYDYLKDNIDFEYMLEYDDNILIDKILQLKEICSKDDLRNLTKNYKILNEYKYLYLKIDKLQEDTDKFEEYKKKKEEELKQRDIDFEKLKEKVYVVDRDKERYERFVLEQNMFLNDLENKISNIDSYEKVTYRLKGFNKLLGNSFKFLGLLLINPLKGLIPGIAVQTVMTRNIIHNLHNNLEWEESRKMVYDAIDYSYSIDIAINDLNHTSSLIDSSLEDISNLKQKYTNEFKKYQGSISEYNEVIKKLNKIENSIMGSKIKVDLMKDKMKEKERQNANKLKRVKTLNSSNNN